MKKKVYIHIGTHKTGTTAVQGFSANATAFLEAHGVYYPLIARPFIKKQSLGHHLIPWHLKKRNIPASRYVEFAGREEEMLLALIESIHASACDSVVLSSEEFDTLNAVEIGALRQLFSDFDVRIIVYLRRKDTMIESMYQTNVLHYRLAQTIEEYTKKMPIPSDYYEFVRQWQGAFGEENIDINLYCKESLLDGNIVVDFYQKLGVSVADALKNSGAKSVNATLPLQYTSLILRLKQAGIESAVTDAFQRIGEKYAQKSVHEFHFLSKASRLNFALSGLDEIRRLGLDVGEGSCMRLSEEELDRQVQSSENADLMLVFEDLQRLLAEKESK